MRRSWGLLMSTAALATTAHRYRAVPFYAGLALAALVAALGILPLAPAPAQAARPQPAGPGTPAVGPLAVIATFRGNASDLLLVAPHATAQPRPVATVDHADGYGLRAAVAPSGRLLAYVTVPRRAVDPARQAELWVLTLDGTGARRLAGDLDGAAAPVWSPDGRSIVVRRAAPAGDDALRYTLAVVDAASGAARDLAAPGGAPSLHAFGWTPDAGAVLVAAIDQSGTDILQFPLTGSPPERVLHASAAIARDFRLAPDGSRVLFNEVVPGGPEPFRLHLATLAPPARHEIERSALPLLNPMWDRAGGAILVGSAPQHASLGGGLGEFAAAPGAFPSPLSLGLAQGFAAPLAWSPEGRWLAVGVFSGTALDRVTAATVAVWDPTAGALRALNSGPGAEFVGWAFAG